MKNTRPMISKNVRLQRSPLVWYNMHMPSELKYRYIVPAFAIVYKAI